LAQKQFTRELLHTLSRVASKLTSWFVLFRGMGFLCGCVMGMSFLCGCACLVTHYLDPPCMVPFPPYLVLSYVNSSALTWIEGNFVLVYRMDYVPVTRTDSDFSRRRAAL